VDDHERERAWRNHKLDGSIDWSAGRGKWLLDHGASDRFEHSGSSDGDGDLQHHD
jgi:hypothetical protein